MISLKLETKKTEGGDMKFKNILVALLMASTFFIQNSYAGSLKDLLSSQIAVEKLTGRGGEYENEFSGWVGSLRFDIEQKTIYISEFSELEGEIVVVNGIYKITKLEQHENSINFECIDQNFISKGIEWQGKIWLTDYKQVKIEMVQKQSPRRWVNLGEYGKRFLRENKLKHLFLGM